MSTMIHFCQTPSPLDTSKRRKMAAPPASPSHVTTAQGPNWPYTTDKYSDSLPCAVLMERLLPLGDFGLPTLHITMSSPTRTQYRTLERLSTAPRTRRRKPSLFTKPQRPLSQVLIGLTQTTLTSTCLNVTDWGPVTFSNKHTLPLILLGVLSWGSKFFMPCAPANRLLTTSEIHI